MHLTSCPHRTKKNTPSSHAADTLVSLKMEETE